MVLLRSIHPRPSARVCLSLLVTQTLFGCTSHPGRSAARYTIEAWEQEGLVGRRILTDHFELISTLQDEPFERALPGFVEAAYQRYQQTLPPRSGTPPIRMRTYVFGTRNEWLHFARRHYPAWVELYRRMRLGAFTDGTTAVVCYVDRSLTLATLAHEGWHQYVGARGESELPSWLNEGLACYHEALNHGSDGPTFTPMRNSLRLNRLREAITTNTLIPLNELVGMDAAAVAGIGSTETAQLYYAQVWSFTVFLRHGRNPCLRKSFERMLADLADHSLRPKISAARIVDKSIADTTYGEAVFRLYFQTGPEELAPAYHAHLLELSGL